MSALPTMTSSSSATKLSGWKARQVSFIRSSWESEAFDRAGLLLRRGEGSSAGAWVRLGSHTGAGREEAAGAYRLNALYGQRQSAVRRMEPILRTLMVFMGVTSLRLIEPMDRSLTEKESHHPRC